MADSIEQKEFFGNTSMHYMASLASNHQDPDALHDWHLELQERMRQPIAFHSEMMVDIMYFNEAMKQHDSEVFVKAVVKEMDGHVKAKNWKVLKRSQVPKGVDTLPSMLSMRRKRNLTTNEVTKSQKEHKCQNN